MSESAIAELFCLESGESMESMESVDVESVDVKSVGASIKTPYALVEEESVFFYTELGNYYLAKTSEVSGGIKYTYKSLIEGEIPFTVFIEFATDAELAEFE